MRPSQLSRLHAHVWVCRAGTACMECCCGSPQTFMMSMSQVRLAVQHSTSQLQHCTASSASRASEGSRGFLQADGGSQHPPCAVAACWLLWSHSMWAQRVNTSNGVTSYATLRTPDPLLLSLVLCAAGQLISRLTSDCYAITRCIATNVNVALRNLLQVIGEDASQGWQQQLFMQQRAQQAAAAEAAAAVGCSSRTSSSSERSCQGQLCLSCAPEGYTELRDARRHVDTTAACVGPGVSHRVTRLKQQTGSRAARQRGAVLPIPSCTVNTHRKCRV